MYNCGPTVYDYAHIGNLRAYIFADTLRRTLQYEGYAVKQVMNLTDIGHLQSDGDEGEGGKGNDGKGFCYLILLDGKEGVVRLPQLIQCIKVA